MTINTIFKTTQFIDSLLKFEKLVSLNSSTIAKFFNNCKVFNINDDSSRVCKFKSIEKTIDRIFSTKKNNVNFFSKIDNDNLITRNNNVFFFSKTRIYFAQKRIKTISNEKIKNEINAFSKKKRRRYKKFTYFEKNNNYFVILYYFTISSYFAILNHIAISNYIANFRKNLFRICWIAFINYYDENFLINFDFIIIKKFVLFCQIYKRHTTILFHVFTIILFSYYIWKFENITKKTNYRINIFFRFRILNFSKIFHRYCFFLYLYRANRIFVNFSINIIFVRFRFNCNN